MNRLGKSNVGIRMGLATRIKSFKCLQILGIQLNAFASPRVIPTRVFVGPLIQVYCTFVLIKFASVLPSHTLSTAIITTALIVYQTFAAQLGFKSEEIMMEWKQERGISKRQRKEI